MERDWCAGEFLSANGGVGELPTTHHEPRERTQRWPATYVPKKLSGHGRQVCREGYAFPLDRVWSQHEQPISGVALAPLPTHPHLGEVAGMAEEGRSQHCSSFSCCKWAAWSGPRVEKGEMLFFLMLKLLSLLILKEF